MTDRTVGACTAFFRANVVMLGACDATTHELVERKIGRVAATVSAWSELHTALRTADVRFVVLDPFTHPGNLHTREITELQRGFPTTLIIGLVNRTRTSFGDIAAVALIGIAGVLDRTDGALHMWAAGREHPLRRARDRFIAAAQLEPASRLYALVCDFFHCPAQYRSPTDLAAAFGAHPKTLREWLKAAELPPTEAFLQWMRLFALLELMRDPGRSVKAAAQLAGFMSARDAGVVARRYLGAGWKLAGASALTRLENSFVASRRRSGVFV